MANIEHVFCLFFWGAGGNAAQKMNVVLCCVASSRTHGYSIHSLGEVKSQMVSGQLTNCMRQHASYQTSIKNKVGFKIRKLFIFYGKVRPRFQASYSQTFQ